jgi:hypothetical protein
MDINEELEKQANDQMEDEDDPEWMNVDVEVLKGSKSSDVSCVPK